MSDTVAVNLNNSTWTDLSAGASNGLVTNESNFNVIVKEAVSQPLTGDLFGHTLYSGSNGFYNWAGITGRIWGRTIPVTPAPVVVAVTRS